MSFIEDFISARDRIISSSIDIISDAGLASLNINNISRRTNLSEMMIYKCFTNTDEILVEVVNLYFRFDKGIFSTLESRNITNLEKIKMYVDNYGTYYNNYFSLSAIMLQYEELLHNTNTREIVQQGFLERRENLAKIFDNAISNGEIKADVKGEMLADNLLGMFIICSLNRRVMVMSRSFKDEIDIQYSKWIESLCNNKV